MRAGGASVAAGGAGAASLRMAGAAWGALIVPVTAASACLSSCCTCEMPKTTAALDAATSTDADATILIIETGVIMTTLQPTDRHQYFNLILRRFGLRIKSSQSVSRADQCILRGTPPSHFSFPQQSGNRAPWLARSAAFAISSGVEPPQAENAGWPLQPACRFSRPRRTSNSCSMPVSATSICSTPASHSAAGLHAPEPRCQVSAASSVRTRDATGQMAGVRAVLRGGPMMVARRQQHLRQLLMRRWAQAEGSNED